MKKEDKKYKNILVEVDTHKQLIELKFLTGLSHLELVKNLINNELKRIKKLDK